MDNIVRNLQKILIVMLGCWLLVWYAIKADRKRPWQRNMIESLVVGVRDAPRVTEDFLNKTTSDFAHQERDISDFGSIKPIGSFVGNDRVPDDLFLLHYRYEGGVSGRVLLQNIKSGAECKSWAVPLEEIRSDYDKLIKRLMSNARDNNVTLTVFDELPKGHSDIAVYNPTMLPDGGLLFLCGHIYRIDSESNLIWKNEEFAHHSMELDRDGYIWTCGVDLQCEIAVANDYREDAVLRISPDGSTVAKIGLTDIFIRSGLFQEVVNSKPPLLQSGRDPYHLNDVQPVTKSGEFWSRDDLFLSMRDQNAVALVSTDDWKIKFIKTDGWLNQHDVSIIDDHRISVFNNNRGFLVPEFDGQDNTSSITIYDFETDHSESIGGGLFYSDYEGRQVQTEKGDFLVEETTEGRYLMLDELGRCIVQFYVPYCSSESTSQRPAWSRFYRQMDNGSFVQLQ